MIQVLLVSFTLALTDADFIWPEYSQQCQDDAGPPFVDDDPNEKYHYGSSAYPVLWNGQCAQPLQNACILHGDAKTAYLEGPISCGDNGWYCRIFSDEENGWDNINLIGDFNFGQCNSEEAFDDPGYDRDGHCHGSSYDNTYYWWIRDHWFRQYNGRIRCCCGWFEGGSQPLYGGRIANRCDYRRLVTSTEDLDDCRDANEDHGMGFDDIGCNQQYIDQIGQPIPEDDSVCWEIERFGDNEEGGPPPTPVSTAPSSPSTKKTAETAPSTKKTAETAPSTKKTAASSTKKNAKKRTVKLN